MARKDFFLAFLSSLTEDLNSEFVTSILDLLDTEGDGRVSWNNMSVRAAWTWSQFDDCASIPPNRFISFVLQRNIIPEAAESIQKRRDMRKKWRARARQLNIEKRKSFRGETPGNDDTKEGAVKSADSGRDMLSLVKSLTARHTRCSLPDNFVKPLPRPIIFSVMRLGHEILRQVQSE
eukprot:INCI9922.2.p2 GENE.INCI9922.2~~INCI9922.2.p2  ORF type:complete len:178 (+),score=20.86 INCI9922.2:746-1279(+)